MWEKLKDYDYQKASDYLCDNSPFTCSMYGNAVSAGFDYHPFAMRSGVYFVYKDGESREIQGILAAYNDGNVMIHTVSDEADKGAMGIISDFHFHSLWGMSGVLPGIEGVSNIAGTPFDSRTLDVMVLQGDIEQSLHPECKLIRIDKKFLSISILMFIKKCLWEGFGFKSSALDIRKRIKERIDDEPYWFLSDSSEYVAQAHVQAMTPAHGYIGGVCTPREKRRQGYAKEIVKRACEYIKEQGRIPALAVSAANLAAHRLYDEMGFSKIGTMLVYMQERDFKGDENS
jgi:ribosomal protein S18 acetylase RimI-like enzyme